MFVWYVGVDTGRGLDKKAISSTLEDKLYEARDLSFRGERDPKSASEGEDTIANTDFSCSPRHDPHHATPVLTNPSSYCSRNC